MLLTGVLCAILGIIGVVAAIAAPGIVPEDAANSAIRLTGLIWAVVFGLMAPVFLYIGWPSGGGGDDTVTRKAKATITGISRAGEVAGSALVELQLEVRPKDGMPYSVTRKFVASRFSRL